MYFIWDYFGLDLVHRPVFKEQKVDKAHKLSNPGYYIVWSEPFRITFTMKATEIHYRRS
jgi:hypothetical protein